ncbi:MAG: translesion error-prone DNA polymerase V autoproteolytic subunit [Patescibacteria group bacterium]
MTTVFKAVTIGNTVSVPYYECVVPAGFPSPADDFVDTKLNLNDLMIPHPNSTFFVKVQGDSMLQAGINSGDMLVVDRSLNAKPDDVVLAVVDGEFTVKYLRSRNGKIFLQPANPRYPVIPIQGETEFQVWGVVTHSVHTFHNRLN